jgi:Tfp pilus assembly protein PilN
MDELDDLDELEAPSGLGGKSRWSLASWLIVGSLALLFLGLIMVGKTVGGENQFMETRLASIQETLDSDPAPDAEVEQLQSDVAALEAQLFELQAALDELKASRVNIPLALSVVGQYDHNRMRLTGISQSADRLTLSGEADGEDTVYEYAQSMEQTGTFERVVIQSISANPELESWSRPDAPSLADVAEEILVGQPQLHTFDPVADVDTFLLKPQPGRSYAVYTTNLPPGVDTVLTVSFGDTTLSNDNEGAGLLSSRVEFQAPEERGGEVMIQVVNLGQFGPEMSYLIAVEELGTTSPDTRSRAAPLHTQPVPRVAKIELLQGQPVEFVILVELAVVQDE